MIFNTFITKKMVTNTDAAKARHRRGCDHSDFDWEKVIQETRKFRAVFRCQKDADRAFVYRVLAGSQTRIPPWAVWDALEAVRQIGPRVPLAYFRVVLRDNCHKCGVDLDKAIRGVRVPATLSRQCKARRRSTPLPDECMRLGANELREAIP